MKHLKIFIDLTRINRPIGFMLLFWPCSFGLSYAYILNKDLEIFLYYLLLFFLGSVLMRSAGCIFNDIVDKDFDKKVDKPCDWCEFGKDRELCGAALAPEEKFFSF